MFARSNKNSASEPQSGASDGKPPPSDTGGDSLPFSHLDAERFESLVYQLKSAEFVASGHKVRRTQGGGDRGLDVVVYSASGKVAQVVQCKNYKDRLDAPALRKELIKLALNSYCDPSMLDIDPIAGAVAYELWCPGGLTDPAASFVNTWPKDWTATGLAKDATNVIKSYSRFKDIDWSAVGEKVVSEFKTRVRPSYFEGAEISQRVRGNLSVYEGFFQGKVVMPRDDLIAVAKYAVGAILLLVTVGVTIVVRSNRSDSAVTADGSRGRRGGAPSREAPSSQSSPSGLSQCKDAYVVVGTGRRGWSWAWMRQVLLASPEFRVLPKTSRAPGELFFKVYDYNSEHDVLVAQCDGDTCAELAATYKKLVPSGDPQSGCGPNPTYQGNGRAFGFFDPNDPESNLPDPHDKIESCARLSVCLLKTHPSTKGDPGKECQSGKRKFDLSCAQRKTCPEVVDCLGDPP